MKKEAIMHLASMTLVITFSIILMLSGCKSNKKGSTDAAGSEDETEQQVDIIQNLTTYPLPTAYEVTEMLQEAGASYILTLSNPASKVGNYISSAEKALNLGVYGTDLSYASTYMMKQETMNYLEATKRLVDDLEISTKFNTDYAERVENNLDSRDSLINIIGESFEDTWAYLVENEQDKLALLVVCGSYIEGMFITAQIAYTAADNSNFLQIIAHQKKSLGTLLEIIEPIKGEVDFTDIYISLVDLAKIYDDVGETLTDEQLKEIIEKTPTPPLLLW